MDIHRYSNFYDCSHKSPHRLNTKVAYKVSHALRGRLRIRIARFEHASRLMAGERVYLSDIEGVIGVTSNSWCGSITIRYDFRKIGRFYEMSKTWRN